MKTLLWIFYLAQMTALAYSASYQKEVTHEDIRDAILSLVHMFRDSGDKLERHEYRERQLGEQLKKALAGLDKRYRSQDQNIEKISGMLIRFEERLKTIETMVLQKEERENTMLQKSNEAMDGIQLSLDKWFKEIEEATKFSSTSYTIQGSEKEKLEAMQVILTSRIDHLSSSVERLEAHLLQNALPIDEKLKNTLHKLEQSVNNIDVYSGTTKWQNNVLEVLERNENSIRDLAHIASRTAREVSGIPNREEVEQINNGTQDVLQELKEEFYASNEKVVTTLETKFTENENALHKEKEDILRTVTDARESIEGLYNDVSRSYEQLLKEVQGLAKVEQVMIQTADNVLDTKRRIEYGVHQILLEVGDLVKIQGKDLNGTVNRRFNDIESTILDNQTGALTNLSSKIETEISQVWRQIGIMYQQLTASTSALDRLQQQTETYVNGSVSTMDSMEGKVSEITSRMLEVDENLNFLLGRLSLVTSEFNQIKSGLAKALDNIRNSFLEVQNQIKDVEPPRKRPISSDEENQVSPLEIPE